MTLDARLTYRCDIQRNANPAGAKDEGGYPAPENFLPHVTNARCFFWRGVSRGERRTLEASTLVNRPRLILPAGTDVTRHDRVAEVRNPAGAVVAANLDISDIVPWETHIELTLTEVAP